MKMQNRLLAIQLLALAVTLVGEFTSVWPLVAAGVMGFFLALVALFVQMTAEFVSGLHRVDNRAMLR